MEELDNISIGAYYQLEDVADYDPLFKYVAPKSCFKGVSIEFNELSYGKVESLKKLAQKLSLANICSMYELLFEVDQESFLSGGVVEFAETMRYITQGLEGILKLEHETEIIWRQRSTDQMEDGRWRQPVSARYIVNNDTISKGVWSITSRDSRMEVVGCVFSVVVRLNEVRCR